MSFINIEIKARTNNSEFIRQFLLDHHAEFKGIDHQTDTYFNVPSGRLKLRQGNIENSLIFYERENQSGPKQSNCSLVPVKDGEGLRSILAQSIGVKVAVTKKREIYFIDNVKFHLDSLEGLGHFVEIEASNKTKAVPVEQLHAQCRYYMQSFKINEGDLVERSYSDMLLEKTEAMAV